MPRFPRAAAEPERRSRGDADGAGVAEPSLRCFDLVQRAEIGRRRLIWPLRSTSCCKMPASQRLSSAWGKCGDAAAATLGDVWNQATINAARTRIEQQLAAGSCAGVWCAQQLLQRARGRGRAGVSPAPITTGSGLLSSRPLFEDSRRLGTGIALLDEARQRFEHVAKASTTRLRKRWRPAVLRNRANVS